MEAFVPDGRARYLEIARSCWQLPRDGRIDAPEPSRDEQVEIGKTKIRVDIKNNTSINIDPKRPAARHTTRDLQNLRLNIIPWIQTSLLGWRKNRHLNRTHCCTHHFPYLQRTGVQSGEGLPSKTVMTFPLLDLSTTTATPV